MLERKDSTGVDMGDGWGYRVEIHRRRLIGSKRVELVAGSMSRQAAERVSGEVVLPNDGRNYLVKIVMDNPSDRVS
jgi:hypothetical protein